MVSTELDGARGKKKKENKLTQSKSASSSITPSSAEASMVFATLVISLFTS